MSSLVSNPNGTEKSYVSITKSKPKPNFPKKEQAILIHAVDNLKLFDYIKAIGDIIGPKNIIAVSRISNNRICIYLSKTELVDDLIVNHPIINIADSEFPLRRLITPAKRVVISNVSPTIPHDDIEAALKVLGLQLASPVSFLRAGLPGEEYSHIISFRRQVYIIPPFSEFELQTSIVITHDNTTYRIFLSTERMECFICKQPGHIANNCKNAEVTPQEEPTINRTPVTEMFTQELQTSFTTTGPSKKVPHQSIVTIADVHHPAELETPNSPIVRQKRPLSTSLDSTDPDRIEETESITDPETFMLPPNNQKIIKQKKKKAKIQYSENKGISEITKNDIKKLYDENPKRYSLTLNNFLAFIDNTFGNNSPHLEALKFTKNVKALLSDMYDMYPFLTERSLKNRFTRITKKLKQELRSDADDIESIGSDYSAKPTHEDEYSDSSQSSSKQ